MSDKRLLSWAEAGLAHGVLVDRLGHAAGTEVVVADVERNSALVAGRVDANCSQV